MERKIRRPPREILWIQEEMVCIMMKGNRIRLTKIWRHTKHPNLILTLKRGGTSPKKILLLIRTIWD